MRKRIDLTGQRFGKLTVLHPAENIGDKTAWVCRCDCGRETVVRTDCLRSGLTTTCGQSSGTCMEEFRCETVRKNNTSGVPGVEWQPRDGRWKATVCFKKKRYYLGAYRNFEDAVMVRKWAKECLLDTLL